MLGPDLPDAFHERGFSPENPVPGRESPVLPGRSSFRGKARILCIIGHFRYLASLSYLVRHFSAIKFPGDFFVLLKNLFLHMMRSTNEDYGYCDDKEISIINFLYNLQIVKMRLPILPTGLINPKWG